MIKKNKIDDDWFDGEAIVNEEETDMNEKEEVDEKTLIQKLADNDSLLIAIKTDKIDEELEAW